MTDSATPATCPAGSRRLGRALWTTVLLALAAWAIWRLAIFPLTADLPIDGAGSMPRAFFTVDHPFHTTRADLLWNAWTSLDTIRWIGSHQGGYPAEFYPFGAQSIAAAVNVVTFGQLATSSAWAITIAFIFLLPGVAYLLIGKVDRLSSAIATLALAGQVSIASDWTHGGFSELVEWGLATNVAGFAWALVALPLLAGAADRSSSRLAGLAALAISMCAVTNPRALLAVAVIGVAVLVDAALRRQPRGAVVLTTGVAVVSAGIVAPLLLPLIRYRDLYFFLSYQDYANIDAYWSETVASVTWPVLTLAALGAAIALARGGRGARVTAIALLLYMTMTAMLVGSEPLRSLIPQLELPRLMPFQRALLIWLAAYGLVTGARLLGRFPARVESWRDAVLAVAASLALLAVFTADVGPFPSVEQGLRDVPRTEGRDAVELWEFEQAVALADERAPDGSAILVIGSRLSWHQQLWAPAVASERRFLYNDWLWYWHRQHAGPYDYREGHFYPDPSQVLTRDYLDQHGIGAVVITGIADRSTGADARQAATASPELTRLDTIGAWDVYTVREPVGVATRDGDAPASIVFSDDGETIRMQFASGDNGLVKVRQNWFPRWEATVNGERVPVERGADGYIEIAVPAGEVEIALRYGVTRVDTIARVLAVASTLAVIGLIAGARAGVIGSPWRGGRNRAHRWR